MSVIVEISLSDDLSDSIESGEDDVPEPELLQHWAAAAYRGTTPAIASILVTSAPEIRQLNNDYRQKDKPTNVLSFPMQSPEEVDISLLGDIVLCASVIDDEAAQQCKTRDAHWAHMVVHGMLHLQGFDHIDDDQADEMEILEVDILHQLGFPDPYQMTETNLQIKADPNQNGQET